MVQSFIVMNSRDNCATTLTTLPKDMIVHINGTDIRLIQEIEIGHKFAITDIQTGNLIVKYGQTIGRATKDIAQGEWIHIHNIRSVYMEAFEYA
jgi:altronate hydrolase